MIGQTISHYHITQKLGAGGMGEVFLAQDISLDRKVAVKFLPDEVENQPQARKRFLREAKAAAAIDHPFICHIYETGEAEGRIFIAMEYVAGETLGARLARGPMPLNQALQAFSEISEALEEAHERGIVHRDLKPSNIMLTPQGHVKIMDFGLAKQVLSAKVPQAQERTETYATQSGTLVGTLGYMSPEQARGEEVDARSDIFSLGVVFYETLSGKHPFKRSSQVDTLSAILRDPPPPLHLEATPVPAALSGIVTKALAKTTAERYQSAREIGRDLQNPREQVLPRKRPAWLAWTVAAIALIVLGLGIAYYMLSGRVNSIAVLPFNNLTGDAGQEYFVDGITDELIGRLGKIRALRVISFSSTARYKGEKRPLPDIARELNVDALVEGTVQQVSSSVNIRVRLIKAVPEEQNLWEGTYNRTITDVLAMYGDVARAIAKTINANLTPQEETRLASARQVNEEVYRAYLRGMSCMFIPSQRDVNKGLAYFQEAVDKDPGDPLALSGLAYAYVALGHDLSFSTPEVWQRAREAAQRALKLDPNLAEGYAVLGDVGIYYERDWKGAEANFKRAMELNPSLAMNHYHYAWYLDLFGRLDEAIYEHKRAQELDPLTPMQTAWLADLYRQNGQPDKAIEEAEKCFRLVPNFWLSWLITGRSYADKGMFEEAVAALRKVIAAAPGFKFDLGVVYARAGRKDEARAILAELEKETPTPFGAWGMANLYAALGEKDKAFQWLNYEPSHFTQPWFRVLSTFYPLRDDPRFNQLLRKLNLPEVR
jgi:TolB-like protein/Flp pilus assembly protein TadD/predicted Ser/Thr protein kinase